jgi:hypothetical protein
MELRPMPVGVDDRMFQAGANPFDVGIRHDLLRGEAAWADDTLWLL